MNETTSSNANVCPQCGAELSFGVSRCWLCRHQQLGDDVIDEPVRAEIVAPPPPRASYRWQFTVGTLILIITLIAVLFGVGAQAPGVAAVLTVAALPALIRTAVVSQRGRLTGQAVTSRNQITTFFVTFACTLFAMWGIVCTIVVVVVVAFFAWCFSGGGFGVGPPG